MPKRINDILPYAALAAALALAGPSLAQGKSKAPAATTPPPAASTTATTPPMTTDPTGSEATSAAPPAGAPATSTPSAAATGSAADTAATSTAVMSGMSVKDNTGALIGDISAVKDGVATIKMGADTFTVDTSKLGVQGGVATINATQADLKKMMPPKK